MTYEIRPVENMEELRRAWHFLYQVYSEEGWLPNDPDGIYRPPTSMGEHALTMITLKSGHICGTTTITCDQKDVLLPLEADFSDTLRLLRVHYGPIAEGGLMATEGRMFVPLLDMFRWFTYFAFYKDMGMIITGTHPKNLKMYKRAFGMGSFGPLKDRSSVGQPCRVVGVTTESLIKGYRKNRAAKYFLDNPIPLNTFDDVWHPGPDEAV